MNVTQAQATADGIGKIGHGLVAENARGRALEKEVQTPVAVLRLIRPEFEWFWTFETERQDDGDIRSMRRLCPLASSALINQTRIA